MSDHDKLAEMEEQIKALECRVAELQREQDLMYELLNLSGENDRKLAETVNRILDVLLDQNYIPSKDYLN